MAIKDTACEDDVTALLQTIRNKKEVIEKWNEEIIGAVNADDMRHEIDSTTLTEVKIITDIIERFLNTRRTTEFHLSKSSDHVTDRKNAKLPKIVIKMFLIVILLSGNKLKIHLK